MDDVFGQLEKLRIVPAATVDDAAAAGPLGDALAAGGLPCIEVTFRTAAAAEALRRLAARGGLLVGAGTVLTPVQADEAAAAGARFIVSPGLDPALVRHCLARKLPILPGACTPTEIQAAVGLGLSVVKFFPAAAFGGLATLRALSGPFPGMRFLPTGGIDAANLRDYLRFPKVLACGGSWMVNPDLIRAGRFDEIARLTREAVALRDAK